MVATVPGPLSRMRGPAFRVAVATGVMLFVPLGTYSVRPSGETTGVSHGEPSPVAPHPPVPNPGLMYVSGTLPYRKCRTWTVTMVTAVAARAATPSKARSSHQRRVRLPVTGLGIGPQGISSSACDTWSLCRFGAGPRPVRIVFQPRF